jgi:succinyl-diaminopimelate desuccinylase
MPYSTDASILAQHMKIPVIILGPGKPSLAHSSNEYVELSALQDATKTYTALILKL